MYRIALKGIDARSQLDYTRHDASHEKSRILRATMTDRNNSRYTLSQLLTLDSRWPYLQKYVMLWFDGMYDACSMEHLMRT